MPFESLEAWHRTTYPEIYEVTEGSHVPWPTGLGFPEGPDEGIGSEEIFEKLHRIHPSLIHFPNDEFVKETAVTLEEMKRAGAV